MANIFVSIFLDSFIVIWWSLGSRILELELKAFKWDSYNIFRSQNLIKILSIVVEKN